MQFVNIVVHSVEDMNFRVHLQHEFTLLGLDEYLEVSAVLDTLGKIYSVLGPVHFVWFEGLHRVL